MTQPRLLGGRYELDGVVGRGGMAEVYRARDIRLDRIVAIKTLRSDLARDHTFQARFRREAQSAASLNHPAVVAVYDTGEDMTDGTPVPYIVMEYVDGRTLRDLLRADRRLLPERAAELVDGILRALDYSHRGGIVHRDIKPANIMVTRNGEVKVMDFGIARAMADSAATMTQTAQVIGTAQYLSPEQARGERVDARSDIYSTGCVLYELLTGQPPFTGDSPVAIAYQHVREDPIPPSRIDPEIPRWCDAIVLKAMAKDPVQRYQSAAEMRADLQRAVQGMPMDPQTMALANNYGQYAGADRTRSMTAAGGPPTQGTRSIQPYEYGPEERGGGSRSDRHRDRGGNTALKTAAWILIPLLIIGAFIGVGYMFLSSPNQPTVSDQVEIPIVEDQTEAEATKLLTEAGFKVTPEQVFSSDVKKGRAITTDPPPGTKLAKGEAVVLKVSKGVETVLVPDVTGKTKDEATAMLQDAGFSVTFGYKNSSAEQGKVIETKPAAGAEAPKESKVRIILPTELVELPSVVGITIEDARTTLEQAGFRVKEVEQASDVVIAGQVIDQSPAAGSKHPPGRTITLIVSSGPSNDFPTDPPTEDPNEVPTDTPTDGEVDIGVDPNQ
ncbi:Stk1 family PASTA domain-containing Ser/Thr kinase [Acrocarpospora macrocephala]|uniref:non-specific serine/threonine protein kinase n=1 Tax=Acrocarpospora macrocephala TaxID=150177 RepID=A0A5M3WMF2_9ACTN|nr:Stk1 family PASTA domain-containing Ser/Thr kinase [Acrocarpospora macrocephala]GES08053.1 putative serine/threonine-protein kinase [Acrocarpospora macrocephala]